MEWTGDEVEKAARWRRLGELGIEEALRESGLSPTSITAVLDLVRSGGDKISSGLLTAIAKVSHVDDAKCVLLAVLGRAASPIKFLSLERFRDEDLLHEDEAIALCVNLSSNPNLRSVHLRHQSVFGTPSVCTLLGNALISNAALKELYLPSTNMGAGAVKCLMDGLKVNKALRHLDLGINPLLDEGIGYIEQMLRSNTTLQGLQLFLTYCGIAGAKHMMHALERNSSLLRLTFGCNYITKAGMTMLLSPLILDGDSSAERKNTTLMVLSLDGIPPEHISVESVTSMIRTNETLYMFALRHANLETRDWVEQIIPALKENHSLKSLDFGHSRGLTVEGAFDAFMDVAQLSGTGLEKISLDGTEMSIKEGPINEVLRDRRFWTSRRTDESEKASRWRRIADLGIKEALRESGSSTTSIHAVLPLVNAENQEMTSELLSTLAKRLDIKDAKCILLAVVGRGESTIRSLSLGKHRNEDALNEDEAIALSVNLSSNPNLRSVHLSHQSVFGTSRGCTLLGDALIINVALKELYLPSTNMGTGPVKCLMDGLRVNKTLQHLDIGSNPLFDEGIGYVAQMLRCNSTLQGLRLFQTNCGFAGAKHMMYALEGNSSLLRLRFGDNNIRETGMAMLLTPLTLNGGGLAGPKNTTLKLLHLDQLPPPIYYLDDKPPKTVSVESVASMIRTNKTLSEFALTNAQLETRDWVEQIIPALKENHSLKYLDLGGSRGLTVEGVLDAFMDVVQLSDTGLEEIRLYGTQMSIKEGFINEELRLNKEYRGRLKKQARVKPESGRLVLCGYEFAGKTSICHTMRRIVHGTSSRSFSRKMEWKNLMKNYPRLRQFLFGKNIYTELKDRTKGFDIVVLKAEPPKVSIWDFAGQTEYYVLHDYLFPNDSNSSFLYVCSARFPPDDQNAGHGKIRDRESMEMDFRYWMRFIASNSKPMQDADSQRRLPNVTFVLSKKDTLDTREQSRLKQWADDIVFVVKEEFKDVIALSETVEIVNANDHTSEEVNRLLGMLVRELSHILDQPTEYAVCKPIRHALATQAIENPSTHFLELEDFRIVCEKLLQQKAISSDEYKAAELNTPLGRESVLAYLNSVGDIIFPKGLNFIVVNPKWFGVRVLGSLINVFRGAGVDLGWPAIGEWNGICGSLKVVREKMGMAIHENGFVRRKRISDLLETSLRTTHAEQNILSSTKLIDLMIHLELCFEEEPGNVQSRLFVPALFDLKNDDASKGKRKLDWKLEHSDDYIFHYIGRRLECENTNLTFLTPGFFPRLQVVLRNFLHERKWTQHKGFEVDQNLIFFATNGMEVFVEYSGDIDYFVDVLVKSSRPFKETLEFVNEHLVQRIRGFCSSPQGCQGVDLVDAVIRPGCVEELHVLERRKFQAVLVSKLEECLQEHGKNFKHTWNRGIQGFGDEDFALDLLDGPGSYKRLIAATQVDQTENSGSSAPGASYVIPQGLMEMQQLPKLFFPTIDDVSIIRKFEAQMSLAEVMPIRLHLMCDGRDGSHQVAGQPGRTIKLNMKSSGNTWPIMKFAVSILWAGVRIGANAAGVHVDILPVDEWINKLFNTPEMPIAVDKLAQMMGGDTHQGLVTKEKILDLLKKYLQIDPATQWLKEFLNLQEGGRFFRDFRLQKVMYTETSEIGWLCPHHFEKGFHRRIIKSVPH